MIDNKYMKRGCCLVQEVDFRALWTKGLRNLYDGIA